MTNTTYSFQRLMPIRLAVIVSLCLFATSLVRGQAPVERSRGLSAKTRVSAGPETDRSEGRSGAANLASLQAEYDELSRQFREQDRSFKQTWQGTSPQGRVAHRAELSQQREPILRRMNELAAELAQLRRERRSETAGDPVPAPPGVTAADDIKDKVEVELQRIGVDVQALHREAPKPR